MSGARQGRRASTVAALVAAVSAGLLSACTDDEPPTPEPTPAVAGLTAPGSRLSFGESARVYRSDGKGRLRLTVETFEKGSPEDLEAIGLADGRTPYYARVRVEPLTTQSMEFHLDDYLTAFAGDRALTHLSIFADFPRCQDLSLTSADPTGAYDSCLTWVAEPGSPPPDAVLFDNGEDYDGAKDTALSWR